MVLHTVLYLGCCQLRFFPFEQEARAWLFRHVPTGMEQRGAYDRLSLNNVC
jgi:hypothetical protein